MPLAPLPRGRAGLFHRAWRKPAARGHGRRQRDRDPRWRDTARLAAARMPWWGPVARQVILVLRAEPACAAADGAIVAGGTPAAAIRAGWPGQSAARVAPGC